MNDPIHESLNKNGNGQKKLPFGDPDGARADLEKIENFIDIDSAKFTSGISSSASDRNIRVIVGKKGAGKTLYLRRLRVSADSEPSVYAKDIDRDIPSTNAVVEFSQIFPEDRVTEAWQHAWRISILKSVFSIIAFSPKFSSHLNQEILRSKYEELFTDNKGGFERGVYTELKGILAIFRSPRNFWSYVNASHWDDLQAMIGSVLEACPPIFLYLDASDDEFAHAPMDWHRCQKGLFYAVMRFITLPGAISSRLHVVIAIRDLVYSSVMLSEHRTRYINSPSICLLDWNYQAIKFFYNRKLEAVGDEFANIFYNQAARNSESFLGFDIIDNIIRGIDETAQTYLLRHTRSIPRDVVLVCNAIANAKIDSGEDAQDMSLWSAKVRQTIGDYAAIFANEQIQICANQLSSNEAPSRSARQGYSELYTSDQEYIKSRVDIIKEYIKGLGTETFSYKKLQNSDDVLKEKIGTRVSMSSILWQNGLIGLRIRRGDDSYTFNSLERHAEFLIPSDAAGYAFHSIVVHAVPSIRLTSKRPIYRSLM